MMSSTGRSNGSVRRRKTPFRTAASRKLVEDYWRSVIHSKGEPPLYHTFSDRYGGTQGIPFAARTDCTAVIEPKADRSDDTVEACLRASEECMQQTDLAGVRLFLKRALTLLQNSAGGLGLSALATSRCLDLHHTQSTAEVLRRLAKLSILCGQYEDALRLLDLSAEADPLISETYVLRASCYERMREYQRAFDELEKYMKLNEPSMDVLAHCGKCAAEAGNVEGARYYLNRLLEAAEQQQVATDGEIDGTGTGAVSSSLCGGHPFEKEVATSPARGDGGAAGVFYAAHAHFYLGVVCLQEAAATASAAQPSDATANDEDAPSHSAVLPAFLINGQNAVALRATAQRHFAVAAASEAYVRSYEHNADMAVFAGDHALALELLGYLARMAPQSAGYHLHIAHVCHLTGDVQGELRALSEALDRDQSRSERRTTLLARGTVYSEKAGDLDRAIKDFSLVISAPPDDARDRCTPVAYLKRAEAYRRRYAKTRAQPLQRKEDLECTLRDYQSFLASVEEMDTVLAQGSRESSSDQQLQQQQQTAEHGAILVGRGICNPQCITDAMLILANGAFARNNFTEAARFFAQAIARGWRPQPPHAVNAATEEDPELEQLFDKMYISLACHVMEQYPVNDDMFKVPYELREWVVMPLDSKRGRAAERKDADKPSFASPSLSFLMVDARYTALRALEPTVFTALESRFLETWEPYRTEVERTRDDVMLSRGGKRTKRHGQ